MKVRIDPSSGEVLSGPAPVLTGLDQPSEPSFSRDGRRMAYVKTTSSANLWELSIRGEIGDQEVLTRRRTSGAFVTHGPALSPDGRTLAFAARCTIISTFLIASSIEALSRMSASMSLKFSF